MSIIILANTNCGSHINLYLSLLTVLGKNAILFTLLMCQVFTQ